MSVVAIFEATYPGAFQGGEISWRYFWALVERMPIIRAIHRQELMAAQLYGGLIQTEKGAGTAKSMMRDTIREASVAAHRPLEPPDQWEAMTASGRRRIQPPG